MEKEGLIAKIAERYKMDKSHVEVVINDAIAEFASPVLFPAPGDEVGFINDNHCTNNCKEAAILQDVVR